MNRVLVPFVMLLLALVPAARAADSPPYSVAQDQLDRSLVCEGDLAAGRTPVLLVPGTGEDPDFFSTNYMPALRKLGLSFCSVTLPDHATGDIQVAAEYVVNAIRTMHVRAGRRITVLGHSQGGMSPRWGLKFFPDTRAMVDDLVGLASSNHGTTGAKTVCGNGCGEAVQQQRDDSNFIRTLNAGGETFSGISYTSVFTHNDEIVTPNADAATGSTALRTGDGARSNVATQDICPANTSEHLILGSTDPVGYALFLDAVSHDGPADAARIDRTVCAQIAQPGVDPATGVTDSTAANAKVAAQFSSGRQVPAEPPLKCYAGGACPAATATTTTTATPAPAPATQASAKRRPHLLVSAVPHRVRAGRRATVHVRVRTRRGKPVAGALVRVAGAKGRTDGHGIASLRKRFVARGTRRVHASRSGFYAGTGAMLVVRG